PLLDQQHRLADPELAPREQPLRPRADLLPVEPGAGLAVEVTDPEPLPVPGDLGMLEAHQWIGELEPAHGATDAQRAIVGELEVAALERPGDRYELEGG